VREGELAQGGSTITQQLAKNAYGVGSDRTITRKVREAVLAAQLDRSLSKEQILFEYLSIVYFGEGAYGIGAAADVYFGKPVNIPGIFLGASVDGRYLYTLDTQYIYDPITGSYNGTIADSDIGKDYSSWSDKDVVTNSDRAR